MPRRRLGGPRRSFGQRRSTFWVDLIQDGTAVDTAAGVVRTVVLLAPTELDGQITIVRIVGAVGVGINGTQSTPTILAWGVYVAGQGTAADTILDPTNLNDMSSEDWLHWRPRICVLADSNQRQNEHGPVDIKVKRKLNDQLNLVFCASSSVAFSSVAALRGLCMRTP